MSKKEDIEFEWIYEDITYIVTKSKKNSTKKKKYFSTSEFFNKLGNYETNFLVSIRDGKIIKDPLKILRVIKNSLKKGTLLGTNEYLLRKIDKITIDLNKLNETKVRVLSNLYNSLVDFIQSRFILLNLEIPKPKKIPEKLKYYKKEFEIDTKGFDKKLINYIQEIIDYYRKYNKKEIKVINGKKLSDLSRKLNLIKESFGEANAQ